MKNKEIPSIPSINEVPLNGIQSNFCTIWKSGFPLSNLIHTQIEIQNVIKDTIKATSFSRSLCNQEWVLADPVLGSPIIKAIPIIGVNAKINNRFDDIQFILINIIF